MDCSVYRDLNTEAVAKLISGLVETIIFKPSVSYWDYMTKMITVFLTCNLHTCKRYQIYVNLNIVLSVLIKEQETLCGN